MLAYDYPLLGVFWTLLWFALFFIWIWLLIVIFTDIFRSHDIGGVAKTLWVLFVIFLPFLGILFYLIFRGKKMHEHQVRDAAGRALHHPHRATRCPLGHYRPTHCGRAAQSSTS